MFVEGAKLSMGDMHFSQGDGEVSFCGAIEMSGFLELKSVPCSCTVDTYPVWKIHCPAALCGCHLQLAQACASSQSLSL